MIRVGVIGLGFMGGVHLKYWQLTSGVEVAAVCDADPNAGKAVQGNMDIAGGELELSGATRYLDVGEMLTTEMLDAVSITLPTHLHKPIAIQCMEAGVHVLCEKPMALSVEDCDEMIGVSKRTGKHLMIAHCIRFWPEYVWLKQAVESGEFGELKVADFSRLTFAPGWSGDSWFADTSKSGGIALDLHIHDIDFIQYLFAVPQAVEPKTVTMDNGIIGHISTRMRYGSDAIVIAEASWMMPKSYGFSMSYKVVFEKGAAVFNADGLTVYPSDGEPYEPDLADGDGYKGEIHYFASLISGKASEIVITAEQARESVRLTLETVQS
jgi:predicted dehydrogenase